MWQDYVFSGAAVAFSYALIPQIIKGFRERKSNIETQTAFITSSGLYVCGVTAYTLDLDLTAALYGVSGTLWGVLLFQSIKYKGNSLENRMG